MASYFRQIYEIADKIGINLDGPCAFEVFKVSFADSKADLQINPKGLAIALLADETTPSYSDKDAYLEVSFSTYLWKIPLQAKYSLKEDPKSDEE